MKAQVTKIAENRMNAIATNKNLSTAPAANAELMAFMSENSYPVLDVMKFYKKEISRLAFESFKNAEA